MEQCLRSVEKATKNLESEIIVVDNNSVDESVEMAKNKFPNVFLIHNNENIGFSRANNQAIAKAKGDFVLLLNPDTLVEEDALETYGMNLGITFQLIDDTLDYSAKQATLGKSIGDDFRDGKITLPVILAFRRGNDKERTFWKRTLEDLEQTEADLAYAIQLMGKHGALEDAIKRAYHYGAIARDAMGIFEDGPEKQALIDAIDFCIDRAY